MLHASEPSPSEDLTVAEEKCSFALFVAVFILSFISVAVRPGEDAITSYEPICPLPFVYSTICISERSLSVERTSFELSLIYSRLTNIMTIAFFASIDVISFIVRPVLKFFLAETMNHIIFPLTTILIVLERVEVDTISTGDVVINLSFIEAAVVENVPTLALRHTISKRALVV